MENIIIFGSGARAVNSIQLVNKRNDFKIISIWDNNEKKWGSFLENIEIVRPGKDDSGKEKIIICSTYYDEIKKQLLNELKIDENRIFDYNFCKSKIKEEILEYYGNSEDREINQIIDWIKKNDLEVFNYDFVEEIKKNEIEVIFDEKNKMYFGIWNGKKLYLKKSIDTEIKAKEYLRSLYIEQHEKSPHRYYKKGYTVKRDDVVVDAGAAEGFFSLDVVDIAKKIYLIEPDVEWIEALNVTFEQFKDKIEIVPYFLGNIDTEKMITLDKINSKETVDFIKMDIEGFEQDALKGAEKVLSENNVTLLVCTYHRNSDAKNIPEILDKNFFEYKFSDGYMFFLYGDDVIKPKLVRGILSARKIRE